MTDMEESGAKQPQWKSTVREDSYGNRIVSFFFEGERGDIQMDAPAGEFRRRYAKSGIISWHEDAGPDRAVEVRVLFGMILVSKLDGAPLAQGDRVQGEIGDQNPGWLISHVRSLV